MLVDDNVKILIGDSAGIYIPRNFYEHFDFSSWGLKTSDYPELSDPENEGYWDSWTELLDSAKHTDKNGVTWSLYQNGDLFALTSEFLELDDNPWFE